MLVNIKTGIWRLNYIFKNKFTYLNTGKYPGPGLRRTLSRRGPQKRPGQRETAKDAGAVMAGRNWRTNYYRSLGVREAKDLEIKISIDEILRDETVSLDKLVLVNVCTYC